MLTILRFIIQFGIKKAIKKYGKKKVIEATKKVVPKSKLVKHKTELQRVKSQIAKNVKKPTIKKSEKSIYKIVKSKKDGMPVWVKKKIIGKSRSNFGKWKPKYED
jgi:hypothetical protein